MRPRAVVRFAHLLFTFHPLFCLSRWQIYEDSIVIKSVFESARQRIVTNEEQKEAVGVGGSLNDNGGRAEDQFVTSAGKQKHKYRLNTSMEVQKATANKFENYCLEE